MKELILNHFGVVGLILLVLVIYMIKTLMIDNPDSKWIVFGVWVFVVFGFIGAIDTFDFIGKWLLK